MRSKLASAAVCVAVCLMPFAAALAQSSGLVNLFRGIHDDPRSGALGEAAVALRGHAGAFDLNPAAVGAEGFVQAGSNVSFAPALHTPYLPAAKKTWHASRTLDARRGRLAAGQGPFDHPLVIPGGARQRVA